MICFTLYALGYRDIVTMMGLCAAIMIMSREFQQNKLGLMTGLSWRPLGGWGREVANLLLVGSSSCPEPR